MTIDPNTGHCFQGHGYGPCREDYRPLAPELGAITPTIEELDRIASALVKANYHLRGDHPRPWQALALVAWREVTNALAGRAAFSSVPTREEPHDVS